MVMVTLPSDGGFWCDLPNEECCYGKEEERRSMIRHSESDNSNESVADSDYSSCRSYRAHFLQSEHYNFCGRDGKAGPLVLSLKYYNQEDSHSYHIRIILRLVTWTSHKLLRWDRRNGESSPSQLARTLQPDLSLTFLQPIVGPNAAELLLNFDEWVESNNAKLSQGPAQTHWGYVRPYCAIVHAPTPPDQKSIDVPQT